MNIIRQILLPTAEVYYRNCHCMSFSKNYKGELTMKQKLITDVIQGMFPCLNNAQSKRLQEVLQLLTG